MLNNLNPTLESLGELVSNIQGNFIAIGELLVHARAQKLHRFKGYEKFNEYVEQELGVSRALALKLMKLYSLYIQDMDLYEEDVKEIGLDKLMLIYPIVNKLEYNMRDEWVDKARQLGYGELKQEVKNAKEKPEADLKQIYAEQVMERLMAFLNVGKKELAFKLALYFGDEDMDKVKKEIKIRQRKFEESITSE